MLDTRRTISIEHQADYISYCSPINQDTKFKKNVPKTSGVKQRYLKQTIPCSTENFFSKNFEAIHRQMPIIHKAENHILLE